MFVSHEKNACKKTFQKPNILRKKHKAVPVSSISNVNLSPESKSLVTSIQNTDKASISNLHSNQTHKRDEVYNLQNTQSILKLNLENTYEVKVVKPQDTDIVASINDNGNISSDILANSAFSNKYKSSSLNIESFINTTGLDQTLQSVESPLTSESPSTGVEIKWALDLSNTSLVDVIDNYNVSQFVEIERKPDTISNFMAPTTPVQNHSNPPLEVICTSTPTRTVSVELFSNRAVKFKCDEPNCEKGFWSKEKLIKHKNWHSKQSSVRPTSQTLIECPVKKVLADGVEEKCARTFNVRRDLLKHLNDDHTPEDAPHKCDVCGRRFFWASGLRAHGQSVCARGGLACAWPGCTRVFRLPCRLREHARAHTGDRPYLCHYPDCGWAFRSASKLVRHARRHTGERRHACDSCGRAFLRPEHLRDHARRHHATLTQTEHAAPPAHLCDHTGCEQTFTSISALYMHKKKVHRSVENEVITPCDLNQPLHEEENSETISLEEESCRQSVCEEEQWHAARTHCTWPLLQRRHHDLAFVLEDTVQIENTEGSANNVYTVRSDLFLHGNVLIDDDSQNIGGSEIVEEGETSATVLDSDLCLIDSHPTVDLMQEELMYEDAAVDESSFRVFLMNGEELT